MIRLFFHIVMMVLIAVVFGACSPQLITTSSYYHEIRPGRKGLEKHAEFVLTLKKNKHSEIIVNHVDVLNYKGYDYSFSSIVCNNETLNKTISSTKGHAAFSIFLDTQKADKKNKTQTIGHTKAKVSYTIQKQSQVIYIDSINFRGTKSLRN